MAEWKQLAGENSDVYQDVGPREAATDVKCGSFPENSQPGFSQILDLNDWNLAKSLDYCERALLQCALQFARGNQSQTARLMGITPRSVYNKIQKHKLRCH